jgi:hypothetical protein
VEQVHREAPRILKSRIEVGESSRSKPRVTTRILLNKWQRQQEKEHYQKQKYKEERHRFEEEAHMRELEEHAREQECAHWGCTFFRHCWNEGLKLPTLRNCPECSDRYSEYRQETVNRRSVHERIGRMHPNDGWRQKINEVIDHPKKRQADQRWVDHRKNKNASTSSKKDMVPAWLEEEPKEKGSTLEEPRIEAGGGQEETSVAPERQA